MQTGSKRRVIAAAVEARKHAVAPYSGFQVGAAILTHKGQIFSGANVESASYGLTCCAERVALFKALTEGARDFSAIGVVADAPGGPMPCGACRQLLAEYAAQALLWTADSRQPERVREFTIAELLPEPFVLKPKSQIRLRK
jgi:cytidine deaminase